MRSDPGSNHAGVHTPPLLPRLARPTGGGAGGGLRPASLAFLPFITALANTLSRDSANYFWAAKRHSSYFSRSSMTLHFFGWPDRKPGTCSGSSRFAACKRQPRSVLAAPPRPSSVPPPPPPPPPSPVSGPPGSGGSRVRLRAHTEAPGLQVAQETSPRLFLAPVLARGLLPKAITEFSSCFADGLEYVKNVLLGDPRALWGGAGCLRVQQGPGPPRTRPLGFLASWGGRGPVRAVYYGCCLMVLLEHSLCADTENRPSPCGAGGIPLFRGSELF